MIECPSCGNSFDPFRLPDAVVDAIRSVFGGGSQTFGVIQKRVAHAFNVWTQKYGPWTPAQAKYATDLVVAAITTEPMERPLVYSRLDAVVHHEIVHEGFKKRSGATVDVSRELAELVS